MTRRAPLRAHLRGALNQDDDTANLRTKILGFRGLDASANLNVKGWTSHAHREFPAKFESTNLSRDNLSREIGRTWHTPAECMLT